MKDVLFILPRLHTNLNGILCEIRDRNYRLNSLCLNIWDGKHEGHDIVLPEKIKILGLSRALSKLLPRGTRNAFLVPGLFYAIRQVRRINPDYIIIREPYMAFAIVFTMASIFLQKKMIIYTQWSFEMPRSQIPMYFWMHLLSSRFRKNFYTTLPPVHPISNHLTNFHYIPFALQDHSETGRDYFEGDKINILVVSKMQSRKRIEDVIIAIKNLTNLKDIALRVVSMKFDSKYEAVVLDLINESGLQDQIEIIFDVPHRKMNEYYLGADIFVLPAENEPCSVSQFEAMSYGNAVIISSDNYLSEYLIKNQAGLSFINRDAMDLASKIEYLINNRVEIVNLGARGMRLIKKNHDPRLVVDKLLSLCG
ncbi:MAG: glycosyltransferase family 4 protein [Saprospiraceae bacterium]|nr:glycosyltransferase family 4 protein [Saprospiraceae bacterium]